MLHKLRTILGAWYAYFLEYRAEVFLWALSTSLPLILMGVWTQAAQKGSFGLSAAEFARYFLCVFVVRQLSIVCPIVTARKSLFVPIPKANGTGSRAR